MIRLTLLLLAGVFAVLSVVGREINVPAGVEVARADNDLDDVDTEGLAPGDAGRAIDRALPATARGTEADLSDPLRTSAAAASDAGAGATRDLRGEPARVNADRVNLRAGPSTSNQVLDQVVRDQRVRVLETDEMGWSRISVPATGLEAWIFGRFLSPLG